MKRARIIISVIALLSFGILLAEKNSIRLNAEGQPDTWTLEGMVQSVTAELKTDRDKALALHEFGMAHQIHFVGPQEEHSYVSDALKVLSVYGYSLCGINSSAMSALYNLAGMKARRRFITGHVVPEIFFDGSWNYIDTDMFGYVIKADGSLASVDELLENPDLLDHKVRPDPFFPFDGAENMKKAFIGAAGLKDCHPYGLSHILSLNLRTGEKVTCYYRPQNRYYVHPAQMQKRLSPQWTRYWIEGPVRHGSLAWTDEPPAAYGNALFEYQPDLLSPEFLAENPENSGIVTLRESGKPQLVAAGSGESAQLVLEVSTPWVIAGLMNDPTNFEDNSEGATVSGWFWRDQEEDENSIEVSADGGRTWKSVWMNSRLGAVPFRVDVTTLVEGRYSYLLKFRWTDSTGSRSVGLSDLKVESWTELSPMALPHLEQGSNKLTVSINNSKAHLVESRWHESGSLFGQRLENLQPSSSFPFLRRTDLTGPGSVTFALGTEKVVTELRLSIEAGCTSRENPGDVEVEALISGDSGVTWTELSRFEVDPEHQKPWMWFNHVDANCQLDGSKTKLKVVVRNGSLAAIKAGCRILAPPRVPTQLAIRHVWTEGSEEKSAGSVVSAEKTSHRYQIKTSPDQKLINRRLVIQAFEAETSE